MGDPDVPGDLKAAYDEGPLEVDGRIPGNTRSEWLRCKKVERLRSKALRFGVDGRPGVGPDDSLLSPPPLMVAGGRGGCGRTWSFPSACGFGTGGSDFSGAEWTSTFEESFLRRQKEDFLETPLAGLSGSRSLPLPSIAKCNGPRLSPLDRLRCRRSWGVSVGGSGRSF